MTRKNGNKLFRVNRIDTVKQDKLTNDLKRLAEELINNKNNKKGEGEK